MLHQQAIAVRSGAERVLELARRRGARGVHASDFDTPGRTADGGKPIRRLAARIDDLRNLGHRFESDRMLDRTVRYRLVRDAGDEPPAATEASEDAVDVGGLGEQLPLDLEDAR